MEKKKNNKLATSLISQETETNESMSKEDQNQTGMGLARKKQEAVCSSSPNDNNETSIAQNYPPGPPPVLQWPYTPQPILKQTQIIPTTSVSNQQQTPTVPLNQWQTSLFTPQGPQQQQPVPQQHQSNGAFWLPPGPGYSVARAPGAASAAYQPLVPMGTTEAISRNETSIPSFSYQGGYPHPMGFPGGPWDPSSWWGQAQQSQPSPYTFAGPYGYFSLAPPPAQDSTVAYGQPHQRGIIQPQAKLSQKHQKMWETQSSENVQLWAAISQLQAEMSTYGSRVLKLEAEVSSLKSKVEENSGAGAGNTLTGQIKRGRPKKVASTDVLPCQDESQPRARARKNVVPKVQSETKILHTEKEIQDLDKYKACQEPLGTATTKQEYNEKISNLFTISCSGFDLNESKLKMPLDVQATSTVPTQVKQDFPGIQDRGFGIDHTTVMKDSDNKLREQKSGFSVLPSEHVKGLNIVEITSKTYKETMNNRNHFWASKNLPDECGRNLLNVRSHAFYANGKGIIQEEKVIPGWNFVNENASEVHEDVAVGSGKDEKTGRKCKRTPAQGMRKTMDASKTDHSSEGLLYSFASSE